MHARAVIRWYKSNLKCSVVMHKPRAGIIFSRNSLVGLHRLPSSSLAAAEHVKAKDVCFYFIKKKVISALELISAFTFIGKNKESQNRLLQAWPFFDHFDRFMSVNLLLHTRPPFCPRHVWVCVFASRSAPGAIALKKFLNCKPEWMCLPLYLCVIGWAQQSFTHAHGEAVLSVTTVGGTKCSKVRLHLAKVEVQEGLCARLPPALSRVRLKEKARHINDRMLSR